MMMAVMPARLLQRGLHFIQADAAVAILVELAEDIVGLSGVGSTGAERAFEFRLGDLPVTIGVDLREQILQRVGWAGRRRAGRPRLALRCDQRAHGLRRYLRPGA